MKIKIGGKTIKMDDKEVKSAKKVANEFLAMVQRESEVKGNKSYYYTTLCVLYILTNDTIKAITPSVLSQVINSVNSNNK